jgi:hypothetical protein
VTLEALVGLVGIGVFALVFAAGLLIFKAWAREQAGATPPAAGRRR